MCVLSKACYFTSFLNLACLPAPRSLVQEPGDITEAGARSRTNKWCFFLQQGADQWDSLPEVVVDIRRLSRLWGRLGKNVDKQFTASS